MDRVTDPRVDVLRGVVLPDRYEPIRRIAGGGMASVWCASDRTLDREVAIKLLAAPYANDEVAGRRFKREARAAARLSGHANVVTIYDVGEAEVTDESPRGRPFLVMEYLPGGTAAEALRSGDVGPRTAVRWLQQAAGALDYAHARGVIHRDVKLANFLLDRDRVLHVADFGIAQLGTEDTLTTTGEVLGTAGYLAPERALGQPATDASDRYALAVAAYELLVGERPFIADNFAALARQHVEEPPPRASARNPALPAALDPVLARGMSKRPEDRYGSAAELAGAIEHALSGETTRRMAPPAPPIVRGMAVPGARYRGRILALAALAAVALGIGIAAGANGGSPKPARLAARPPTRRPATRAAPVTHASAPPSHTTASVPPSKPTTTAPATPAPAPSADALEAQGHQLMMGGNYSAAIPVLRQAVSAAPRSSLTYAYAMYDLGRSLRLAGDPRDAVQVLWQRLQIPNQQDTVRAELALALRALGQRASGGAAAGPDHGHGHAGGADNKPPAGQGA